METTDKTDLKNLASKNTTEILLEFESDLLKGLSTNECKTRIKKYGLNIIPTNKKRTWWQDLLGHFKSPLIILLLIASIISLSLTETLNASIIFLW